MTNESITSSELSQLSKVGDEAVLYDHHARLGEYTAQLWKDRTMTDVKVVVDGVVFPAHKAVLTCYSPFFQKALILEKHSTVTTFDLSGVDSGAFDVLLRYMYTGELEMCCRNIADVYKTARKLEMEEAIFKCMEVLTGDRNDVESLLVRYVTARMMGMTSVHMKALTCILERFEEVVLTREFMHLTLHELQEIITQDTIGARNEVVIFLAALKWLNYEFPDREPLTLDVMRCVRFPLMDPDEVLRCHYPPLLPHIMEIHEMRDTLLKGVCYSTARNCGIEGCFQQYACPPRNYLRSGDGLVMWDISKYDSSYHTVSEVNLAATRIQASARGYLARKHFHKALKKKSKAAAKIQACWRSFTVRQQVEEQFGYPKIPPDSLCEQDILSADPWLHLLLYHPDHGGCSRRLSARENITYFPMMRVPKVSGSLLLPSTGTVLAVGGINPTSPEDDCAVGQMVIRYNPKDNQWERFHKLAIPRHHHCAVYHNEHVYVIGGCDPRVTFRRRMMATDSLFILSVTTGRWTVGHSMATERVYHGATVINGNIFVVGGKDKFGKLLSSVERYEPDQNRWSELDRPLCCPRMAAGVASYKGLLWVAGGFVQPHGETRIYAVRDVECYDPITNKWLFTCTRIPRPRVFCQLVSCEGGLYLVGGCGQKKDAEADGQDVEYVSQLENPSLPAVSIVSMRSILVYDSQTNHWVNTGIRLGPRHDVAVASNDGTAYYAGGLCTGSLTALDEMVCHQPQLATLKYCKQLPIRCTGTAIVALPASDAQVVS